LYACDLYIGGHSTQFVAARAIENFRVSESVAR
jgi:hypothetical protein